MRIITTKKIFFGRAGGAPSAKAPDDWPAHLKKLQSVATLALKGMPRAKFRRLSAPERAEVDDLLTMMRAMADERKTAAVYFEMAQAMGEHEGRPPSVQELSSKRAKSLKLQAFDFSRTEWHKAPGNHRFSGAQSCQGFHLYGPARSVTRFTRRS
jgi:hypothetical protein